MLLVTPPKVELRMIKKKKKGKLPGCVKTFDSRYQYHRKAIERSRRTSWTEPQKNMNLGDRLYMSNLIHVQSPALKVLENEKLGPERSECK